MNPRTYLFAAFSFLFHTTWMANFFKSAAKQNGSVCTVCPWSCWHFQPFLRITSARCFPRTFPFSHTVLFQFCFVWFSSKSSMELWEQQPVLNRWKTSGTKARLRTNRKEPSAQGKKERTREQYLQRAKHSKNTGSVTDGKVKVQKIRSHSLEWCVCLFLRDRVKGRERGPGEK